MRSVLIRTNREGAAIFGSVSMLLAEDGPSSYCAVALCSRSEAIGHAEAVRLGLGELRRDHHLLLRCSSASLLPLGRLASRRAVGVAQRLVNLSAHPQAVQEHRELPRCCHHRPLLCVLAPTGGYLLSVASQVRVRAEGTQDVVGAAYQELP